MRATGGMQGGGQVGRSSATPSVQQSESLPPGWEARHTEDGRVYYVCHNSRTTTWTHPGQDLGPLPQGWEKRKATDGRTFFIDHSKSASSSFNVI